MDVHNKRDFAITKNAEQDNQRAQMKATTKEAQNAIDEAYKTASTRLDALIGIIGKTTELGRQAAKLRSVVNRFTKKSAPKP